MWGNEYTGEYRWSHTYLQLVLSHVMDSGHAYKWLGQTLSAWASIGLFRIIGLTTFSDIVPVLGFNKQANIKFSYPELLGLTVIAIPPA